MISKFCPVGHLILIFIIRRILPPPSHFSSKCTSPVYMKSALDLVWQFCLKMMLGGHVWIGDTKYFRGDLPWMMPCIREYSFEIPLLHEYFWKSVEQSPCFWNIRTQSNFCNGRMFWIVCKNLIVYITWNLIVWIGDWNFKW